MKTAKEYNVFVDKKTRRIVGKVLDVPSSMEDMYEEITLPEPMRKMIDKVKDLKKNK